jgi:ADP-ribose pyrophosphatase YjhB (NUDIX family)
MDFDTLYCHACGQRLDAQPPTRCAACGVDHWNDAKPCASALVVDQARLLLVRRAQDPWKGLWDVPGGFCDSDEHPIQTAEREILEEIGLRVVVTGFLGMWLDDYGGTKRTLNIYYHAKLSGPRDVAIDPSEIMEMKWFLPSDLPDRLAFPGHLPDALDAWRQAVETATFVTSLPDRPVQSHRRIDT